MGRYNSGKMVLGGPEELSSIYWFGSVAGDQKILQTGEILYYHQEQVNIIIMSQCESQV